MTEAASEPDSPYSAPEDPGGPRQAGDVRPATCPFCDHALPALKAGDQVSCPGCQRHPNPPADPIEKLFGWFLVVICLAFLVAKLLIRPDGVVSTPDETMNRFQEMLETGQAQVLATVLGLGALLAMAASVLLLPRMISSLLAALRNRTPRPLTMIYFLLAFGGTILIVPIVLVLVPAERPRLVRGEEHDEIGRKGVSFTREEGKVVVTEGTEGDAPVKATWQAGSGRLEVRDDAPPVQVDGQSIEPGQTAALAPGSEIRIGDLEGRVEGGEIRPLLYRFGAAQVLGILALLWVSWRLRVGKHTVLRHIGLHFDGWKHEVLRGGLAYAAFLPIYFGSLVATQWLSQQLDMPVQSHTLVRALQADPGLAVLVIVQAVILAPLLEEAIHRGFALDAVHRALGPVGALLVTALAFALLHEGFTSLLPMFALGFLFAALRFTSPTDSLIGSITAHALHNGLTLTFVLTILAL